MSENNMQPMGSPTSPPGANPTVAVVQLPLGPDPVRVTCFKCNKEISTVVNKEPSTKAYIAGLCLFCIGCSLGCCLIPCCMDSCKNSQHYCPHCNAYLGLYKV